ncbi:MAG: hypothetical protein ACPMAQ_07420 [Phycisphaerae bacterium]
MGVTTAAGRRNRPLGRALAVIAAGVTAIPVAPMVTALATGFLR